MEISLQQTEAQLAKAIAKEIDIPINDAILETAGHLKGFIRMDNAFLDSIDLNRQITNHYVNSTTQYPLH